MKQKLILKIIATLTTPPTIVAFWHMLAPESVCWLTDAQMGACVMTMLIGSGALLFVGVAHKELFDEEEE